MSKTISSYVVGRVKDRALIEIKDGDHEILVRIIEKDTIFKLTPIVYKVNPETGCWICLTAAGHPYPQVRYNGKMHKVSRLIYEEFTGIDPGELQGLHKCDNPECINPAHLYLGTAKDNIRDWKERGKSNYPSQRKPLYKRRKSLSIREYWERKSVTEPSATQKEASQLFENKGE